MKKAEEYLKELFEEPFNLEEGFIEYDFLQIIKKAQEDAIRETVKECTKSIYDSVWIDRVKFFSVTDKLIKEL